MLRRISIRWLVFALAFAWHAQALAQVDPQTTPEGEEAAAESDGEAAGDVDEAQPTQAPSGETILWTFRTANGRADEIRRAVREALADQGGSHLLSTDDLRAHVARIPARVPACFKGIQPCVAPEALVFDHLELSSVIRVSVDGNRTSYQLVDRRGEVVRDGVIEAQSPREAGFAIVREVFDATGTVSFETDPPGATVFIDGTSVGSTPLKYRLPIGSHEFTLRMQHHHVVEGEFEISSGATEAIRRDLQMLPGTLVVRDAPEDADVLVNGEPAGKAGQPIDLAPGNYSIEVKASGYETVRDAVTIEPGLAVRRSVVMRESNPFLRDISTEAIAINKYVLRLGFLHGGQSATFQDMRSGDDVPLEFLGLADDAGNLPTNAVFRRGLNTNGVRFDAAYSFRNFGLVLLSLSYLGSETRYEGFVARPSEAPTPVTITRVRRLQLKPFQVFYRYFYKNFVPFVELGIGINFQWMDVQGPDLDGPTRLRHTDAFWALGIGAQYYFTPNFFATARYGLQPYFVSGPGADHQVGLGIGVAFSNLFGFDAEPPEKL